MDSMPYNQLIPHLASQVWKNVYDNNRASAEKYCFTILCEKNRLETSKTTNIIEIADNKDDLLIVEKALEDLQASSATKPVYDDVYPAFKRYAEKLAA